MLKKILEIYSEEELLIADGFDEAVIGIDENSLRIIYSIKKCIQILTRDMCEEDAVEEFSFSVLGTYVGEKTPIWCRDDF